MTFDQPYEGIKSGDCFHSIRGQFTKDYRTLDKSDEEKRSGDWFQSIRGQFTKGYMTLDQSHEDMRSCDLLQIMGLAGYVGTLVLCFALNDCNFEKII